ncbi:hypothetical protein BDZ45DRAFT_40186 [Acephala macrosclerotiorum]|nr:hypothetical protein BDZ45DRAFT_40186 [Acephala macrosclerotiorum]
MEQLEFHDAISAPGRTWLDKASLGAKIEEMILNEDPSTGRRTLLQRHQPGSLDAKESLHDYIEEIFIVEGDLGDKRTGLTYQKGYYAYRNPGMVHGPFFSKTGCLMFITHVPVQKNENEQKP